VQKRKTLLKYMSSCQNSFYSCWFDIVFKKNKKSLLLMTITMGFGIISITIEYIMKCTTHLNHYLLKNKVKK